MLLGSEKYTMIGEIGRGNYAKVIKAKVSGKSNYVSLKLQKPACLWEYYISKKIHERLNSTEKVIYLLFKHFYSMNILNIGILLF